MKLSIPFLLLALVLPACSDPPLISPEGNTETVEEALWGQIPISLGTWHIQNESIFVSCPNASWTAWPSGNVYIGQCLGNCAPDRNGVSQPNALWYYRTSAAPWYVNDIYTTTTSNPFVMAPDTPTVNGYGGPYHCALEPLANYCGSSFEFVKPWNPVDTNAWLDPSYQPPFYEASDTHTTSSLFSMISYNAQWLYGGIWPDYSDHSKLIEMMYGSIAGGTCTFSLYGHLSK